MAPAVLLEYTKETNLKSAPQDLEDRMMGKKQKLSNGYSSGFVSDYRHAAEKTGDSEGFGSTGRTDSEGSCTPKRKSISLNVDNRCNAFNIPSQVISLSKVSHSERTDLERRLRAELTQVQILQKKIASMGANGVSVPPFTGGYGNRKLNGSQAAPQPKSRAVSRFKSAKHAKPVDTASHANLLLMKQCRELLKRMMTNRHSWIFNKPVDIVKLNIPDYFTVIKQPMDFSTIMSKIDSGAYSSPWGFLSDVRLTFKNALTYNPPSNAVHVMAETMSKIFETRWKFIEKKLSPPDTAIVREEEAPKPTQQLKKRKSPSTNNAVVVPEKEDNVEKIMSNEEKRILARRLESLMTSGLPDHITDFLRRHSDNGNQISDGEIEIDLDALSDDTLFEVQKLLDDHQKERAPEHQTEDEQCVMEILNESGPSNSSMQPCKASEAAEEDVDIGGNDPPISSYPPVEIEKDTAVKEHSRCSTSSSSSSESSSSSSDSDSACSSGSDTDVSKPSTPTNTSKEPKRFAAVLDQDKSDVMNPADGDRFHGGCNYSERNTNSKAVSCKEMGGQEGESAPSERQVSPEKLYRAALLRNRFADTILKAREKKLEKVENGDPEKMRRQKEELEKQQREEKARLQAEAKAAEQARRQAEAAAAAATLRKRELEREAARQALLKVEKSVQIDENSSVLKDLEMLRTAPAEQLLSSINERSPDHSQAGISGFKLVGNNPLEQLGLFIKEDDDEEEEVVEHSCACAPVNDVEEGEID